ncbi:MAG TPA: outer membrane protein assembly factor BamE [Caulobacter sp.]|nr:outer membrane protein assembly factor BamE [Caulobacter sp.]
MTRSTAPLRRLAAAGLIAAALAACSPVVATRGHMVDPDRLAEVKVGESTRDDVQTILGSPTNISTFDPNVWYYVGQRVENAAFFRPDVTERRVVAVRFDDADRVAEIQQIGLDAAQEIELVERTTPTSGREFGVLEQLFGNFGRFTKKAEGTE